MKQRRVLEENAARAQVEVGERFKRVGEELVRLESLREKELHLSSAALAQGIPVPEMELARFREIKLMHEVNATRNKLAETEQEKAVKEAELISRVKDRRLLEKVREQHFQDWKRENDLQERKDLDEIAIIRAARAKL
ncbi:flagellar FliJ family protein [bacterium]|nr:flagellar FliJ family protein [bacterium]